MLFDYTMDDPNIRLRISTGRGQSARVVIDIPKNPHYFQLVTVAFGNLVNSQFADANKFDQVSKTSARPTDIDGDNFG